MTTPLQKWFNMPVHQIFNLLQDTLPQAKQVSELYSKVTHPPSYRKSQIISMLPLSDNLLPLAAHKEMKRETGWK